MEKYFNTASMLFGLVGGVITGISFIENVSEFLPLPQKMKDIFIQIREKDVDK